MLANRNFSEFFADFEDYRTINNSLRESVQVLAEIKRDTEDQMTALEEETTRRGPPKTVTRGAESYNRTKRGREEHDTRSNKGAGGGLSRAPGTITKNCLPA